MSTDDGLRILGYGAFFDIPHGMYVSVGNNIVHMEAKFDHAQDDYRDFYEVAILLGADPSTFKADTARSAGYKVVPIGTIPVADVAFDPTRRKWIKSNQLERMVAASIRPDDQPVI